MAEYTSIPVKELLKNIKQNRVILPAMQRNFVWPEEKVCKLFESIMKDYPIGTFLFWNIDKAMFDTYVFNVFLNEYDEAKGKMQRGDKATADFSDYTAVLDGQQRITSLNIGINGKYRTRIKGKKKDDPNSYVDNFLCLDIMFDPKTDEEYKFAFIESGKEEGFIQNDDGTYSYWVPVSKIVGSVDADDAIDPADYVEDVEQKDSTIFISSIRTSARKMMAKLQNAICEKQNISYYSAKNKSLAEVVEIFVRVNSGGQKLDSSDLMLSVAAGEQGDVDIHVKIQEAVEEINASPQNEDDAFKVDKELILTAGLMFTEAESLSLKKSENWSSSRMNEIFKDHWDAIVDALKNAVIYIEYLGFIGKKLTSKNLVLPIAYYFYHNTISLNHKDSSSNRACCDRIFIRQWLLRAMMNNVFSDATGSTLLSIRSVIQKSLVKHFPLEDLMKKEIKRPLKIEDEQIEAILSLKYGDSRIIPIFNELGHLDNSTNQVDHMWPKSILMSKKAIRKEYPTVTDAEVEDYQEKCNYLPNLQLLSAIDNQQKADTCYGNWVVVRYPDDATRNVYFQTHFVPTNTTYEFSNFQHFFDERRKILEAKIKEAFPSDFGKIVRMYNLSDKI